MSMRWRGETFFSLFLLALALVFIVISLGYPVRAAFGPLAVGIPAAVLLVIQIMLDTKNDTGIRPRPIGTADDALPRRNYVITLSWIIGFPVATYFLGILLVFPLFTLAYVRANRWSWRLSICLAGGVFVLIYWVFGYLLRVSLYKGLVFR